jgi:hypothetical protein
MNYFKIYFWKSNKFLFLRGPAQEFGNLLHKLVTQDKERSCQQQKSTNNK